MSDFFKIKDVISVLPLLIIYVLPGYVFISIVNFIVNKKDKEDKNLILKSLIISYIVVNIEKLLFEFIGIQFDISSAGSIIFSFVFTIVIAYIYSMIADKESSNIILKKLKIARSFKSDIIADITDFELGMWIKVFVSSEKVIYVGKLRRFEQTTDTSYTIVLSNFILYKYSGGDALVNYYDDDTEWVMLSLKDNYRIELVFNPASKKIIT